MGRPAASLFAIIVLYALGGTPALAETTQCPLHYASGMAPDFPRIAEAAPVREICFQGFSVLHSGATRTPIWVGEHLTRENIRAAKPLTLADQFHVEERLPASERSEVTDYARSGYDRGLLAPSQDMPSLAAREESFSLANAVPLNPRLSRGLWNEVAQSIRERTEVVGELFVVSGPIFRGASVQRLERRVFIPTHVYKAVHDKAAHASAVFLISNSEFALCKIVSLAEFADFAKLDVFPGIPQAAKEKLLPLASPIGPAGPRCE